MKTLIINALTAALLASIAKACATYDQCRCTMADNTINNTITEQACDYLNVKAGGNENKTIYGPRGSHDAARWCVRWDNSGYISNCDMREACTLMNATGADSWCELWTQGGGR
ncbi:hypothetical protein LX32DRAFT_727051 [Colletotrichum zoysiae]|uniref:Uncharacterized protein n=1 Tax=Colletotrichum zoysiae TaxID=1216348 RepID=A0AAD9HMM6_9PEZI|nr:hypothetical protein LX32DRAFT_727051 [Colletotrichum zoysiae]